MTDDVIELAELTRPAPETRWTGRHTGLVFGALVLIAGLIATLNFLAAPLPPGDRLLLQAAPSPAWTTKLADDESAIGIGGDLIVIHQRRLGDQGAAVRGIDPATGRELWRHNVRGHAGPLQVRNLPGTGWLTLQAGAEVTLLDRLTGNQEEHFTLPDGDGGDAWFGSSDKGTLLMAVPSYGSTGRVLTVSRLASPDPDAVVWSREVPLTSILTLAMRQADVVEREGLLLLRSADGWRGSGRYSLALRTSDGRVPDWTHSVERFVIARGVAVFGIDGRLEGRELRTGRELWRLEPASAYLFGTDSALIIESMGELRRLDPYSGRTQWTTTVGSVFTALVEHGDQLIFYEGAQTIFPDRGTTKADSVAPWVGAIDLSTGRPLWRTTTPSPVLDVMLGTDTVIARMYDAHDESPTFEVAALTEGGQISWVWRDQRDSWSLTRLGSHLATIDPDGTLTLWN